MNGSRGVRENSKGRGIRFPREWAREKILAPGGSINVRVPDASPIGGGSRVARLRSAFQHFEESNPACDAPENKSYGHNDDRVPQPVGN
jgi:hypothetical protein